MLYFRIFILQYAQAPLYIYFCSVGVVDRVTLYGWRIEA